MSKRLESVFVVIYSYDCLPAWTAPAIAGCMQCAPLVLQGLLSAANDLPAVTAVSMPTACDFIADRAFPHACAVPASEAAQAGSSLNAHQLLAGKAILFMLFP